MKEDAVLLLDTHIWFWWVSQNDRLPNSLQTLISQFDGRVSVSAASVYDTRCLPCVKEFF
jgi:PIN domain nuclease of toxin-antitoxin system